MRPRPRWLSKLGQSPDAVYVVNDAQRIVCWNAGAQELLGYSEDEVLNQACYRIIAGKVRGKSWCHAGCAVQRSAKRGMCLQNIEMQTQTRSGDRVWLNTSIFTLKRKNRQFTIHLLRDMTIEEHTKELVENFLDRLRTYGLTNGKRKGCSGASPGDQFSTLNPPTVAHLTRREIEVLKLLAEGLSSKALAQRLGVSPFTVRRHVETILLKTGLHTQAQAVAYAYRSGLL